MLSGSSMGKRFGERSYDCLIDFNGISNRQRLFSTTRFGNRVTWISIFTLFCSFLSICVRLYGIGQVGRVFTNGLGDLGSIPCRVIPKTLKMVLDTTLLNTQHYKIRIKGKVEQSRERSSALPYTSV